MTQICHSLPDALRRDRVVGVWRAEGDEDGEDEEEGRGRELPALARGLVDREQARLGADAEVIRAPPGIFSIENHR
jgi:hypothetical protein